MIFLMVSLYIPLHNYDQPFLNLWSNLLPQQSGNARECSAGKKWVLFLRNPAWSPVRRALMEPLITAAIKNRAWNHLIQMDTEHSANSIKNSWKSSM